MWLGPRLPPARHHLVRVLAPARLERELYRGLAHVEVDALAEVLDVDEVRARLADEHEQARERAGPVGNAREQHEAPPGLGLVASRDSGEQAGVDVAAAEDDARRPV